MILVNPQNHTVTPSSGSVSQNIRTDKAVCYQIIVTPTTPTTTFDVSLTDIFDNKVVDRTDLVKVMNDTTQYLTYGNWTLDISNASADEEFKIALVFREQ